MPESDKDKNTRDLGVTLVNPRIDKDINRWLYEVIKKQSSAHAEKFRLYREAFDRAGRLEGDLPFPLHLIIEAYYGCNYRCPQCYIGIPEYREKFGGQGLLSMEEYKKIIDEAARYETPSILLNGVNEPLMDKHLFERINYARDNGFVDIHLHSNGELLDEGASRRLIESGCTRLMVSLDAFSADTFAKIRVGGHYDKVMANIARFLEIRREMKSDLPVFRVSMVRQKQNHDEIQPFIDYWTPRADYIYLQTYMELINTRDFNYFADKDEADLTHHFRCEQPWYAMWIRPKGDVHPCCSFMNYYLDMGNRTNRSLKDIWDAKPYRELRALHQRGEYEKNEACRHCVAGLFPQPAAEAERASA